MTRQLTEHSKTYLKQYFKTRYENDPEFRRRAHESNNLSRYKTRVTKRIEMMVLDVVAECYQTYVFVSAPMD